MKGLQKVQSKFCAQSGTWTYTNDVLGNRLTKAPAGLSAAASIYSWDILNRMTSYRSSGSQNVNTYKYRADGLRVKKTVPGSTIKSTFYRYDGQMSIEEYSVGSNHLVNGITRNTLGARGIDMIQRTTATVNETSYPLYDAHGNMTAQLLKNGASFTVANEKSYDAWGGIRVGNFNPEYKGRYCANLGHTQDDESSLIYMRARYYEPSSGRFMSEDPKHDGSNWYVYAKNKPISGIDPSGQFTLFDLGIAITEQMRLRAQQAAALAVALQKCGSKIQETVGAYNFRLSVLCQEVIDDCTFVFNKVTGDRVIKGMEALEMNPSDWQKVYAFFNCTDKVTGDAYQAEVHFFYNPSTMQVFDVALKRIN
jgi:RHS repeat-associated protein